MQQTIISATTLVTSLLFYSYARNTGRDTTALVMIGAFTGTLIGRAIAEQISSETNRNKPLYGNNKST